MQLSVIDPWSNLFDNESHNAQHCACIEKNNTWVAHQTSLSTTFMSNHLNCTSTYKIFLNFEQKCKLKMICFKLRWHEDISIFLIQFLSLFTLLCCVETELLLCLKIFISMEISAKLTMISHLKSQAKQAVVEGASTE